MSETKQTQKIVHCDDCGYEFGLAADHPQSHIEGPCLAPETMGATQKSFPLFRCPKCRTTGTIDEDQFHGRVSIVCEVDGCEYHETKDWSING